MNTDSALLRQRVVLLNWLLPLALVLLAILYQLVSARLLGPDSVFLSSGGVGILIYAALGAIAVFYFLKQIRRWLKEMEKTKSQPNESQNRLAQIAATSADAIVSINAAGYIDSWNYGAERLFGFESSEAIGHSLSDLLGGGSSAEVESHWLLDEVRRTGSVRGHETTCLDVDGYRVEVELTASILRDHRGDPAGMSLVLRDITRRRRQEVKSQQINAALSQRAAERNYELAEKVEGLGQANVELQKIDQTRSEFVSLVSHQIRAPLTNMGGAVQRMQMDCTTINPTCARMFTVFEQQLDRLDRLVQDVLNASLLEAGEVSLHPEPISMMPIVRQTAAEIRSGAPERTIQLADKPGLPLVYADRDRVAEVLANLLDNAEKYSPLGEEVAIRLRADQTEVTVTVRDAGPGIAPQDLERIFDKFYRTDSSDAQTAYGYGLGLYVCRQLMEAQGGRIWAENHPDGGALFSFALPVWQEEDD